MADDEPEVVTEDSAIDEVESEEVDAAGDDDQADDTEEEVND